MKQTLSVCHMCMRRFVHFGHLFSNHAGVSPWAPFSGKHNTNMYTNNLNEPIFISQSHRTWSTNDQSVVCEGRFLRRFLHLVTCIRVCQVYLSNHRVKLLLLGVDCHMFAACTGLYISSRCSCTDIAGACICGCTCTTTAVALHRELEIPASIPRWAGHRHFSHGHAWLCLWLADVVGDCISRCQPGS